MPQIYQSYVTQISNSFAKEKSAIEMLEKFSPVAFEMSKMALIGLESGMDKSKLNTQIQQSFSVNKRHANSVISFVNGELKSAQEAHKRHIDILGAKIKSINKKISDLNKRLSRHREYVKAVDKRSLAIKYPQITKAGKLKKVATLKNKPEFDNACPINGKQHGKTYLQVAKFQLHSYKQLKGRTKLRHEQESLIFSIRQSRCDSFKGGKIDRYLSGCLDLSTCG